MRLLSQILFLVMFAEYTFGQELPGIEVRAEYIWHRTTGDGRVVLMKDTTYQEMLKRSFIKTISQKWNRDVSGFSVRVNRLPLLRMEPKFNPSVSALDTSKWYIFLQLFDEGIAMNPDYSMLATRISVKYRLVQGAIVKEDLSASYNIMRRQPAPGQVTLNRFPFYPSHLQYEYDTIAYYVVNGLPKAQDRIWLNAACGYTDSPTPANMNLRECEFDDHHQSISMHGEDGFTIMPDSTSVVKTGKFKHGMENTIGGLITFFSNVDSEKKRSTLYTAVHSFKEGFDNYKCSIHFVDTKVADRRRVKDEEGFKSLERSEYRSEKHIRPDVLHSITLNGDTMSEFQINYTVNSENFGKMWDGSDSSTIDTLSAELNNVGRVEMEVKGKVDNEQFELVTSDLGRIKKLKLNGEEVFALYGQDKVSYHAMDSRKLKFALLLCLLCDKYYQYK
ncbi:MAG: hypothetical protein JNK79_13670 [Chitinophagaceae bacterium]|nr:hypothetical protein [Chitinophagaceae bacterium]